MTLQHLSFENGYKLTFNKVSWDQCVEVFLDDDSGIVRINETGRGQILPEKWCSAFVSEVQAGNIIDRKSCSQFFEKMSVC